MRILAVGPLPIEGDVIGGTKVSFANLVEELRRSERYELEVHDTSRPRAGRGHLGKRLDDLRGLARLLRRLLSPRRRPDLVLFNTSSGGALKSGPLVWAACRWRGVPLVVRVFGGDLDLFLERAPALLRAGARRTWLRAELVLLQTHALCERFGSRANARWWPTTRDLALGPASPARRARRFLFLSQLRREKGPEQAARAAAHLPSDASLTIHGPDMPGFDARPLGQLPRVELAGPIDSADVRAALLAHDVLVFPSYHEGEGMPGVVIEALQMGLPVIATNWRSLTEIVTDGESGLVVEARDVGSLAAAMTRLASDDALFARLRRGALARGEEFRAGLWTERLVEWISALTGDERASPTLEEAA